MILVDKPYLSDFLIQTIRNHTIPVIATPEAKAMGLVDEPFLISTGEAGKKLRKEETLLYTTSENSIGWISQNLAGHPLLEKIDLFKNKAHFRKLLQPLYPDFYFREIGLGALETLDVDNIPLPCIIKPNVGFFSIGVHKISRPEQWPVVIGRLHSELHSTISVGYPQEVINTTTLIIEQCIAGEEYAVDAYFDTNGKPVILNIHHHLFSSNEDVGDRVYVSSPDIITRHLADFENFLGTLGRLSAVKNFPVHVELRKTGEGGIYPIEVNPLRFGGWCTTADATFFAYGFNPYLYYFNQQRPDWNSILEKKTGKHYAMIVLDNSSGIAPEEIDSFDYGKLLERFSHPLELRKIDFKHYPVFGFLFAEMGNDDLSEIEYILRSDLSEFIASTPL